MAEIREIASGLRFPEGPIAMADGSVLVCEMAGGRITRCREGKKNETVAELGGGPNGAAIGPDGALYVCNNGGYRMVELGDMLLPASITTPDDYSGGRIERVDLGTGEHSVLYSECDGHPLCGPNDIVFDATGNMWFTDHGKTRPRDADHGGVYYAAPDGSMIREVLYPLEFPNGIGLSPEGDTLWVAESLTCRLYSWPVTAPGEVILPMPDRPTAGAFRFGPGGPQQFFDSMGVEASGNVVVATIANAGLTVVAPDGELVEHVPMPDGVTTNVDFGGEDLRTAYVTLSSTGRLVATEWPRPGLPLAFSA